MFLISNTLIDTVSTIKTIPGYSTDHSIIKSYLTINPFPRGKGTWKFNCTYLSDIEYVKLLNKIIEREKIQYAVPVYNQSKIQDIPEKYLHFIINDNLFLDTLLLQIIGETIRYASKIKKR